jgi:preprotein translocase subunit SecG
MYIFITILVVIAGVLLGAIVLIQNPKGGGLSASMGGVGQQLLGARRSTDVVEKATWGLAGAVLFFCLSTSFFVDKKGTAKVTGTTIKSEIEAVEAKKGFQAPVGAPAQQPQGGQPAAPAKP